jgi:prepilin-type N-terminal cleavage/methylation domain-containing protein
MVRMSSKKGFTLVEVLAAVAIIAIMISILVPALNMIRKMGRDVQEKAQIAAIEVGVNLYKNDFGDYPQSHGVTTSGSSTVNYNFCGAQTLTEAMFGQDFLGVDPNTDFSPNNPAYNSSSTSYNINNRKGPYLDRTHFTALKPSDVFKAGIGPLGPLAQNLYVICDVYPQYSKMVPPFPKKIKIGTPILYFKANISLTSNTPAQDSDQEQDWEQGIYNFSDNSKIIKPGKVVDSNKKHDGFIDPVNAHATGFYNFINDPLASTSTLNRPVRPDSFLLISAGFDGEYGTSDDICNFEPNIE